MEIYIRGLPLEEHHAAMADPREPRRLGIPHGHLWLYQDGWLLWASLDRSWSLDFLGTVWPWVNWLWWVTAEYCLITVCPHRGGWPASPSLW